MDLTAVLRLALVFSHLLLCVFALHCVLSTDWRVLQARLSARRLRVTHGRLVWLLAGLWVTGALMAGIDMGFDFTQIAQRPKFITKLVCVTLLTLNGVVLKVWCMPRMTNRLPLGRTEALALTACGATSTASWLMAAFLGIARPLHTASLEQCLALYAAVLAAALIATLFVHGRLVRSGPGRPVGLSADTAPGDADLAPRPTLVKAGAG